MALNELKITEKEISENNVKAAADTYREGDVRSNKNIFDRLPELIAHRLNRVIDQIAENLAYVCTEDHVRAILDEIMVSAGAGDMTKYRYDKDDDGVVDDSNKLGGKEPDYYAKNEDYLQLHEQLSGVAEDMEALTTDIKHIKDVTALPVNPDESTLYLIKK